MGSTLRITARAVAKGRGILRSCASFSVPRGGQGGGGSGAQTPFRKFSVNSLHCRLSVNFCDVGIGGTQIIVCSWKKEEAPPLLNGLLCLDLSFRMKEFNRCTPA